MKVIEFLLY